MNMHPARRSLAPGGILAALLAVAAECAAQGAKGPWHHTIEIARTSRDGKPQAPIVGHLWVPEGVKVVKGLFYPGTVVIDHKLAADGAIRQALTDLKMGIVYFNPGLGGNYIRSSGAQLEKALAELAAKSGHPEVEFAPLLTTGHSAAGIGCRNVAYWKPHRVIGVLMLKSGNFHHGIEDLSRSLAGVPLMMISGEFEEYGPEGGDLGIGLRSEYSTHPTDKKKLNQTQWVMARMQMLDRRKKNPDNLMSLVVHRGKGHTSWDDEVRNLAVAFIRSAAAARIPIAQPDGKTEVRCNPLKASDCWLYDADLKAPAHKPATFADYGGDKLLAFCVPDKALAEAITAYHAKGWEVPDPTAGQPVEQRFYPPAILRDMVDAPPPKALQWRGTQEAWSADAQTWLDGERVVRWDESCQAVLGPGAVALKLAADLNCRGLQVGQGCTLDLQSHRLRVRWHATMGEESVLRVSIAPDERPNRNGRLWIEGNASLGGTLIVESAGESSGGKFPIVTCGGIVQGKFSKVVVPDGWQAISDGQSVGVEVPKSGRGAKAPTTRK